MLGMGWIKLKQNVQNVLTTKPIISSFKFEGKKNWEGNNKEKDLGGFRGGFKGELEGGLEGGLEGELEGMIFLTHYSL